MKWGPLSRKRLGMEENMEHITIRELTPEDAQKMIAYLKQIGAETDYLTFGEEGLPVTIEQEKEYLKQEQESERSVHYGAWKGEELIGEGSLSGYPRRMSHLAELGLTVIKAHWNKGIGSMLLDQLIAYARKAGIEIIMLEVRSDNAGAIHLYEKYGFRRVGLMPAYFKIENAYFDFVRMCLDLR